MTRKPNIVFVLCDNVGWGDFGVYGGGTPTPRIDRLASEGIRFNNYTVDAAAVAPARRLVRMTPPYVVASDVRGAPPVLKPWKPYVLTRPYAPTSPHRSDGKRARRPPVIRRREERAHVQLMRHRSGLKIPCGPLAHEGSVWRWRRQSDVVRGRRRRDVRFRPPRSDARRARPDAGAVNPGANGWPRPTTRRVRHSPSRPADVGVGGTSSSAPFGKGSQPHGMWSAAPFSCCAQYRQRPTTHPCP
ncbi:MAG TPA: sulfatase-like hydrolase/transferase [Acidimicrobiales bacterium]